MKSNLALSQDPHTEDSIVEVRESKQSSTQPPRSGVLFIDLRDTCLVRVKMTEKARLRLFLFLGYHGKSCEDFIDQTAHMVVKCG